MPPHQAYPQQPASGVPMQPQPGYPAAPGQPQPAQNPWSQAGPAIDLSAAPTGAPAGPGVGPEGQRRRRYRVPVLVAASVVVMLLLGGGAVAAVRAWNGTGKQPEEAMPASVSAFVRLDLSPGIGQGRKLTQLLEKFPRKGGGDTVAELKKDILDAFDVDQTAYRQHVEPWFADRIGVGVWSDAKQRPYVLVAAASDDDAAAGKGLTAIRDDVGDDELGFVVKDGYALIAGGEGDSQAAATAAAADAAKANLAGSAQFDHAVSALPEHQTLLAWTDLAKINALLKDVPGLRPTTGSALLGSTALMKDLKGTFVIGAQPTSNGVEVRLRGFGMGQQAAKSSTDALAKLDGLPGSSSAAAVLGIGDFGDHLADQFILPGLTNSNDPDSLYGPDGTRVQDRLNAISEALKALSGSTVSVALNQFSGDLPALLAAADASSADRAESLEKALQGFGDQVKVDRDGNRVELTTSGYTPADGKLTDKALYREAMADMPDGAQVACYINVQKAMAESNASAEDKRQIEPVKAVGFAIGFEDADPTGLIRIVIK